MSIESRMNEFKKVADTTGKNKAVDSRMDEFQKNIGPKESSSKSKEAGLPFGLKQHKPCIYCSGTMILQEVKQAEALYTCSSCNKNASISIRK